MTGSQSVLPASFRHAHCTFAVTDALAFNVKVHVLVLLPPLEQAPDQMTSRVLLDDSVIDVPPANDADPVLPTATLMPAGLDEIRSPLRPVAVTVRANDPDGGGDDGVTVKVAVLVAPPNAPLIVTGVDALTAVVAIVNVALVAPAGTVTLAGNVATLVLLLVIDTVAPPLGAALFNVAVPVEPLPPTTLVGLTAIAEMVTVGGGGGDAGVTVSDADAVAPPKLPVIVTGVEAPTAFVAIVKLALVAPAGTVTLAGTVAAPVLLLESDTAAPPLGAALFNVAVPVELLPPTTRAGLTVIAEMVTVGGRGLTPSAANSVVEPSVAAS